MVIVFSSFREFKFSEEYLLVITDILGELSFIVSSYLADDKEGGVMPANQAPGNGSIVAKQVYISLTRPTHF